MYTTVDLSYISDTQFLAYEWAKKTFGKIKGEDGTLRGNDRIWFARSADDKTEIRTFYFKHPADATMFSQRWL